MRKLQLSRACGVAFLTPMSEARRLIWALFTCGIVTCIYSVSQCHLLLLMTHAHAPSKHISPTGAFDCVLSSKESL